MNSNDEKKNTFKYGMAVIWGTILIVLLYLGGCIPQVGP